MQLTGRSLFYPLKQQLLIGRHMTITYINSAFSLNLNPCLPAGNLEGILRNSVTVNPWNFTFLRLQHFIIWYFLRSNKDSSRWVAMLDNRRRRKFKTSNTFGFGCRDWWNFFVYVSDKLSFDKKLYCGKFHWSLRCSELKFVQERWKQ